MKRFLSVVLVFALMLACAPVMPITANAEEYTSGYYTYTVSNGEATITDCDESISGDITIPATLGGYPVTSIGDYAFINCRSLTGIWVDADNTAYCSDEQGVLYNKDKTTLIQAPAKGITGTYTIPDSVTSIGHYAFMSCSSLTSIVIPDSVTSIGHYAFMSCSSLTSVVIGDSVTSIGYRVFAGCVSLTSVVIPDSVTSIGEEAFSGCSSLIYNIYDNAKYLGNDSNPYLVLVENVSDSITSCNIHKDTKIICNYAFQYCSSLESVVIGDSVTSIGVYAFSDCSSLTSIVIPDSVTSIGGAAFSDCSNLTNVEIPDSVTSIGARAFMHCSSLTSVTIPDGVTSIGEYTFSSCSSLTSVVIGDSVTSIGEFAFYNCSSLTNIEIPDSVTRIDGFAFYDCSSLTYNTYDNAKYLGNDSNPYLALVETVSDSITSCDIHKDTKIICGDAFYNCSSLTSIEIPDSVTIIGNSAFYNCSSLTSVVIPDSVTSIGYRAFAGSSSLESVVISDSVTRIDFDAFRECSSLTDVYYAGTEEQWNAISIDSGNEPLTYATIHFADDDVEDGNPCIQYLTWEIANGEAIITGCDTSISGDIVIPDILDGCPVTGIGDQVFYNCSRLTSVVIPDSVTSVGYRAFDSCDSLVCVEFPDSVTSVGYYAFSNCNNLTYNIYDNAKYLGNGKNPYVLLVDTVSDGITSCQIHPNTKLIGDWAFSDCSSLMSIRIPDNVTRISAYAFIWCSSLESVETGECVTSIGMNAFTGCSSLISVTIPDSVTSISDWAFSECSSLTSVIIPDSITSIGNDAFSGCSSLAYSIYDNGKYLGSRTNPYLALIDSTSLSITSCQIHPNTKVIGSYVLANCESLETVEIPDGITSIGHHAFWYCSSLTSIAIPDSVTSIGSSAFSDCSKLKDVYYAGTQEQWNVITIRTGNEDLINATIHYNHVHDLAGTAVHKQGDTETYYKTLEEALAVTGGTIKLLMDTTADTIILKPGVTLDLNGYTLTANLFIAMDGAKVTDGGEACIGGGSLKIAKGNLALSKDNGNVIALWNGVDGYIFTKVTYQQLTKPLGNGAAQYIFLPSFSNAVAKALLADGGADNDFLMKVSLVWNNGQSQQFYTYGDDLVEQVFASGGRLVFSLTVTGIANIHDMTTSAVAVTDTGAQAAADAMALVSYDAFLYLEGEMGHMELPAKAG